jgi:poly(A) polymerase
MTSQQSKNWGVTSPLSLAVPKPEDLKLTQNLQKVLKEFSIFQTHEESVYRQKILSNLNHLFRDWIKNESMRNLLPEIMAEQLGGKIYAFGSFRLGVHQSESDIDAVCIGPRNISRKQFFTSFYKVLKQQPEVTECRSIEDAFVPVIKLKYDDMEIDLVFARMALKEIPNDIDLKNNDLLKNLDPKCIRSLNGVRVADEILEQVPNVDNFKLTLRAIKLFAKGNLLIIF